MSQARKKGSLSQNCGKGCNHVDGRSHGRTVSRAWPGHCLKEVRALKGVPSGGKQKGREHIKRWIHNGWKTKNRLGNSVGTNMKVVSKKVKSEVLEKLREERNRKLYPLRRRSSKSKDDTLSCHVLLTRLEKDALEEDSNLHKEDPNIIPKRKWHKNINKSQQKFRKTKEAFYLPSKIKQKATTNKTLAQEPRKRRLASLNAEAVNSLLLDKTDSPSSSKHAKKQHHGTAPFAIITNDETNSTKSPSQAHKTEMYQSHKQAKTSKAEENYDKELSFYSITPRRLAGLNAAALLKLTSATAASKQRIKTDSKGVCTARNPTACSKSRVKQPKKQGFKQTLPWGGSAECKSSRSESKLHWEGAAKCRCLSKPGYQARSMMGYPLKVVKKEQVEAGLCPCFCCSAEGSVEYCHRLALFLGQKAYSETDEHPVTSVKHECLVASSSLSHPALTLSTHPCLCADPCYSSFYVHVAHHGPRSASLSTQALPCPHNSMCPSNVPGSKLLSSSDSHASGISSSVFCPSVRSPGHSDGCRVGSYTFSAMQPVAGRVCSYTTGCPNCNHQIKTESYPSPQGDQSSPLLVPPALPLSGSPLPRLSPSSAVLPRLVSTLTDNRQTDVRLQGARKCPQNTKPTNGSIGMGPRRLSQKKPMSSPASAKQQKKVSHHRTTNGWHPFGKPTEKEVYIAGEDETAMRQCYEGVQRDGEVIRVRDTVLLRSGPRKKSLPYVAKISAFWNDPKTGELMMSLFWYYRPEHTQGGRDPSAHCENEIFASRHQDENSVACIEDRCYVLPLAQYCRFCALVKRCSEGVPNSTPVVPRPSDSAVPSHRLVPEDVDPDMVYLCRHVYDFRYGRILKNPQ